LGGENSVVFEKVFSENDPNTLQKKEKEKKRKKEKECLPWEERERTLKKKFQQ